MLTTKDDFYSNDFIAKTIELAENGKWVESPSTYLEQLAEGYKKMIGKAGITSFVKTHTRAIAINGVEASFFKDLVEVVATDSVVDFSNYVGIVDFDNESAPKRSIRKIDITSGEIRTPSEEFSYLLDKLGVKQLVYMLVTLNKTLRS